MLWELVAGKRMYRGLPEIAVIKKLLDHEIPPIRAEVPDIDPQLEAIIDKALAPDKDERYETAADLQVALDAFVESIADRRGCRDVGKLVATAFEDDRRQVQAIVEQQLKTPAKPRIDQLPMIELATMSVSGHTMDHMGLTPSGRSAGPSSLAPVVEPSGAFRASVPIPVADGARPSSTISSVTMQDTTSASARPQPRRSYALIAVLALIGGAAAAVGVVALQKTTPPASSAPAAGPTSEAQPSKAEPASPASSASAPASAAGSGDDSTAEASASASGTPIAVKPIRRGPVQVPATATGKPPPPPPPSDIRLNR